VADLIGTTIGNYRIDSLLGTGGMGQVYLGVHLHLNRPAAIKVMHAHMAAEESFNRRFRQEARAVAALNHPNIVQTWDFGVQDDNSYLVMELLTDGSLRSLLASDVVQQPGWAIHVGLDLVRQAAEGLAYAHSRGMVHRDIKPDNLMLCRITDQIDDHALHDLQVKITDFGLARLTEEASATGPSLVMGTPAFMSPELCQGLPVDGRSDVYSLGVVLYQVVTGRLPFETRAVAEAAFKHVHATPPRPREYWPEIPESLEAVILRCLAKDPDERYTSSELVRALRDVQQELIASTPIPSGWVAGARTYPTPSPSSAGRQMATPSSAAVAHVVVAAGSGGARQVVELNLDGLVIGSLPSNDLVIGDAGVFGRHLRIDWDGERAFLTDLGSSGGTLYNGEPLTPHRSQPWEPDDELRIGERSVRLIPPAAAVSDPAGETIATPVPITAGVATAADDATMAVQQRPLAAAPARSRVGRLPMFVAAACIAVLLSVGGMQALSFGDDVGDNRGDQAAPPQVTEPSSTATSDARAVVPEETPTATETTAPQPTATATRTPTPTPTPTTEPTATEPPPPPPANTPVPPTPTVEPPTQTPAPAEPTVTPEGTTAPEPTAPVEPTPPAEDPSPTEDVGEEPTPDPTESEEETPETSIDETPSTGVNPAPAATAGRDPGR